MTFSVNTNVGALVALQNLSATNSKLLEVQNRVNTGLKVATAKDDGAIFAIAQKNRADVSGLNAVKQSLDRGQSAVDVALNAGGAISDLLVQMKEKVVAATDTSLDTASRTALDTDFQALLTQITNITDNSKFNGADLVGKSAAALSVLSNDKGGTITISATQLTLTALGLATADLTTATRATAALASVDAGITTANSGLAKLGTASKKLAVHNVFVGKLQDTLTVGIGNLVDADLARESSRLQALQIQQQLGIQALSIANSAPSALLALFG